MIVWIAINNASTKLMIYLPPANEVRGKVIFLHVCVILSTGGACLFAGGRAWLPGGRAWLPGVVHGCWGACMVAGGMHGCGGHTWLWGACVVVGGVHGCKGVCVVVRGHAWLPGGHA